VDQDDGGYALLDAGDLRRLERFGDQIIDRPAPGAREARRSPASAWAAASARYERDPGAPNGHWAPVDGLPSSWTATFAGVRVELRPTPAGQVGLFPEHAPVARWAAGEAEAIQRALGRPATVLNLFAYTGLASLVLGRAGARLVHVDASRPAVAWARRNAALAGLDDRPIRWLVDDATRFVAREARRGRVYDGILLDPPTYGHGPGGGAWRLADDLEPLVRQVAALLAPERWFLACTAHATALEPGDLAGIVGAALGWAVGTPRVMELGLEAESGVRLAAGWAALATSRRGEAQS
jgi:23S rRNA (cytosine1962-C5)-methyltransferase